MIYFIRHGETDYNKQGIAQGQLDIPLNEKGIMQAEQTRELLKDYDIDVIYSSPLTRAYKTAQIINEYHNKQIIIDKRIIEYNMGTKQGEKVNEPNSFFKEILQDPKKFNAETGEEFIFRVVNFFKEINLPNKNILVVSHGGVFRAINNYTSKSEEEKNVIPTNCQVLKIEM